MPSRHTSGRHHVFEITVGVSLYQNLKISEIFEHKLNA